MVAGCASAGVGAAQLLAARAGCRFVRPLHVRLVDDGVGHGTCGRASGPQSNASSTTTPRGTNGAESRSSRSAGSRAGRRRRWPNTSGCQRTPPSTRAGVGVEQQLGRVVAHAAVGVPGAVDPHP